MGATLGRLLFAAALVLGFAWALNERPPAVRVANACGSAGPFDFDTYEVEHYFEGYAAAIGLAVEGKLFTSTFTVGNETVDLRYQGLKSGPRTSRQAESTAVRIPPSIYRSIVYVEADWANAADTVYYGGVGPVLRTFDCGYGLGQVTSGMENNTGTATAKQAAIGTHYLANIAEGVRILADKWNQAPRFRPIAGNGDPAVLEDWYYAIWSYNGFAFSNHPLNPMRDPLRGGTAVSPIFHCNDPAAPSYQPAGNGLKYVYGDYTYSERVYGCMQYPPRKTAPGASSATRLYPAQNVTMPDFRITKIAQAFDPAHFLTCQSGGFNSGCPNMDFPTAIEEADPPPGATPTPGPGGGGTGPTTYTVQPGDNCTTIADAHGISLTQLYALNPSIDEDCMNLEIGAVLTIRVASTPTPAVPATPGPPRKMVPHIDTTPPANAALAATLLAQPLLVYSGPTSASLSQQANGTFNAVTVQVANAGTGIGAFRIRTTQPWISVRHPGEPANRNMDGGVAIGSEIEVVTQSSVANPPRPRLAQDGYTSVLSITALSGQLPVGTSTGKVFIEPILGSGGTFELTVTATRTGEGTVAPATATAIPTSTPAPGTTPTPDPYPYRAVAPNLGKDQ